MHENARTLGGALPRRSSAGLAIAAVLGYLVYAGGNKLNLKTFFNITGILLVLFAAGLAGKAIHEFRELIEWEAGWLISSPWTIASGPFSSGWVHDFLKALFGWAPAPERPRRAGAGTGTAAVARGSAGAAAGSYACRYARGL